MDKRKINLREDSFVNNHKVNEAFLNHADFVFHQQQNLKMKAQMAYMKNAAKKDMKDGMLTNTPFKKFVNNEYLWNTTGSYYTFTVVAFYFLSKRYNFHSLTIIPFLAIPPTLDFIKREFYVSNFPEEKKKLNESRKIMSQILKHKKSVVRFPDVYRFVFLNQLEDKCFEDYQPLPEVLW
ncbi:unnamed protein product [Moneuplotes crassus]|uniref:Uncharacterized protein n=1 Tax=Euplotes crassus TaxID=5936 RepID=A0AAD1XW00_EUPCR|nr:unnamed protein product [Moneuplotes crassus]